MQRRQFIALFGAAAVAWPLGTRAQQKPVPVIGYLNPGESGTLAAPLVAAFRQGLSDAGFVDGQNVAIEYRSAEGHYDRLPALAVDLVGRKVDVIVTIAAAATLAAKSATSTIPIVFMGAADPVGMGLVASLARPGGNATGFSNIMAELNALRFALLTDLIPQAKIIAVFVNPSNPSHDRGIRDLQEAARAKGVQLSLQKASTESDINTAFATLVDTHADALFVIGDPFFASRRDQFLALASRHAVPAMYIWRDFAAAGGLISYGISNITVWRQAGIYAGRILKGAKPADLPVQQPSKFELVINMKTAKALGLTVPPRLLARADEVIE